ncbi:OmpA/MotB family protein [Segetibacter aerophilus]|uniref:Flagellar motor protein MotB n=1 Tax=Segetibacter aerophilus TaxID=670293 RepID=A0A512B939_9BACT|nr:flagellar motor protein MotB [Segetibacter aerophilus]GEO08476.1 flagellar motor protein MotB [Segetibacter aerophilus]
MLKNLNSLLTLLTVLILFTSSCVPKRQLLSAEETIDKLRSDSTQFANRISKLEGNLSDLESRRTALQQQLEATRKEATSRLQDASSRLNMSQEQIADQQRRLEQLQSLIDQQKKNTELLRSKITDALVGFNSNELTVSTKNGKVYVSLQENLLFPSGSAVVNPKGKQALGKLADVLNSNPNINVNIEGHTDSIPMRGKFEDNWALSVGRSTAIVRILTDTYKVDPTRVTASGRSKYVPVDSNSTAEGRGKNRRTEIILEPKLDELMQLIQNGNSTGQ